MLLQEGIILTFRDRCYEGHLGRGWAEINVYLCHTRNFVRLYGLACIVPTDVCIADTCEFLSTAASDWLFSIYPLTANQISCFTQY